jgi:hypothetical protein
MNGVTYMASAIIILSLQTNAAEYSVDINEPSIIIKDDEPIESFELPNGDIHYRVQFFGKDFCVRVTEPDPLDSFDVGATYWVSCN